MNCEIEFLPVGEGSSGGDAIIVRYGTVSSYELMIVDAGYADTGEAIVAHVRKQFPGKRISHALLTHGDRDHAGGFRTVLAELPVDNFWLHQPWDVDQAMLAYFADKKLTVDGLRKKIREQYDLLNDLVEIAADKEIAISAPFAGAMVGPFRVLTPSLEAYRLLVPQFDRTPDPDAEALKKSGLWIGKAPQPGMLNMIMKKVAEAVHNFSQGMA